MSFRVCKTVLDVLYQCLVSSSLSLSLKLFFVYLELIETTFEVL